MLYNGCLYRLCMAICYKIESHVIFIQEGERQKMGEYTKKNRSPKSGDFRASKPIINLNYEQMFIQTLCQKK